MRATDPGINVFRRRRPRLMCSRQIKSVTGLRSRIDEGIFRASLCTPYNLNRRSPSCISFARAQLRFVENVRTDGLANARNPLPTFQTVNVQSFISSPVSPDGRRLV